MDDIQYISAMEDRATEFVSTICDGLRTGRYEKEDVVRYVLVGAIEMLNKLGFVTYENGRDSVVSFVKNSYETKKED